MSKVRTFAYRKLIRDKILDSMVTNHEQPIYHQLNDSDYLVELQKKIMEEASEINLTNPDEMLDELVDLQEIIDAMLKAINRTTSELAGKQQQKRKKYGGFDGRIYLHSVQKSPDDPWLAHLLTNPDRYPEIT